MWQFSLHRTLMLEFGVQKYLRLYFRCIRVRESSYKLQRRAGFNEKRSRKSSLEDKQKIKKLITKRLLMRQESVGLSQREEIYG